jgi:hypothetical protein
MIKTRRCNDTTGLRSPPRVCSIYRRFSVLQNVMCSTNSTPRLLHHVYRVSFELLASSLMDENSFDVFQSTYSYPTTQRYIKWGCRSRNPQHLSVFSRVSCSLIAVYLDSPEYKHASLRTQCFEQ